jgi:hypothetical protein
MLTINNKRILIDPMLSEKGTLPPVEKVPNQNLNPLVDLPININEILNCDALLVTHAHRDHFDNAASELLPKNIPLFCQPEDKIKFETYGFTNIYPINTSYTWEGITFNRTKGKHGHGLLAKKMAPVSGFIICSENYFPIYIAGDSVWCTDVKKSINYYKPKIIICNCGGAQFHFGSAITMNEKDIKKLCQEFSDIQIIAVHMNAWNHCRLSKEELKKYIDEYGLSSQIRVPDDGAILET